MSKGLWSGNTLESKDLGLPVLEDQVARKIPALTSLHVNQYFVKLVQTNAGLFHVAQTPLHNQADDW